MCWETSSPVRRRAATNHRDGACVLPRSDGSSRRRRARPDRPAPAARRADAGTRSSNGRARETRRRASVPDCARPCRAGSGRWDRCPPYRPSGGSRRDSDRRRNSRQETSSYTGRATCECRRSPRCRPRVRPRHPAEGRGRPCSRRCNRETTAPTDPTSPRPCSCRPRAARPRSVPIATDRAARRRRLSRTARRPACRRSHSSSRGTDTGTRSCCPRRSGTLSSRGGGTS